jgi:hypothetical protein
VSAKKCRRAVRGRGLRPSRTVRSGGRIEIGGKTAIGPNGTPAAPGSSCVGGCDLLLPELLVEIEASAVVGSE